MDFDAPNATDWEPGRLKLWCASRLGFRVRLFKNLF